jgi:L-iditol 2-dehydrogenase
MRAFQVMGPGDLSLREVDEPRPGPGEVVLQVRAALTCGTDLKILRRGHPIFPFPTPLGHEYAGVVVEAGAGARFGPGTEIACVPTAPCGHCPICRRGSENLCDQAMADYAMGGFADRVLLPRRVVEINAFEKPAHVPWHHAAFLEPLACVVHGQRVVQLTPGETVVVLGAGPIGLLHVMLARHHGAARVLVVGRRPARLEAARELGADVVVDERAAPAASVRELVFEETGGLGADVVIECAATPEAWEQAVTYVRRGGRVLWFGGCKAGTSVTLDTRRVHYDEITLMGVFHFTPRAVADAHRLLADGAINPGPLLSGTVALVDLPLAFERLARGEGVKYAVIP